MADDDFLSIEVLGERNLLRNLDRMPDIVRVILVDKVRLWTERMASQVRENIGTRFVPKENELLNAVRVEVTGHDRSEKVEGRVFIDASEIKYANIQEKGGGIPPHIIRPKTARVLAFYARSGEKVFATRVFHPGAFVPGRHYMKDAYRQMAPEISRGIKLAVIEGIRKHMRGA